MLAVAIEAPRLPAGLRYVASLVAETADGVGAAGNEVPGAVAHVAQRSLRAVRHLVAGLLAAVAHTTFELHRAVRRPVAGGGAVKTKRSAVTELRVVAVAAAVEAAGQGARRHHVAALVALKTLNQLRANGATRLHVP